MVPTDPDVSRADGLRGLQVVSFESRRAAEMAELIRRHSGEALSAPSVRELPLEDNRAALDYVARLAAGDIDIIILMTGVGLRTLIDAVAGEWPRQRLAAALRRTTLIARGPKPAAALRELGLQPDITVPEPNTWREILATLDTQLPVAGKRVAVQEYGVSNTEFIRGLETRRAQVLRVPIYEWALPEDLVPLRNAINALCDGRVDAALFTSATQVYHLFQVAGDDADRLRNAFHAVLVASIGPVCSEALREHGVEPDLEPTHAKMGQLVGEVARRGLTVLRRKRET